MSHLAGLITINIPPGEDIVGNDTNVVYIDNGLIRGDDNFAYLYGTANPTVTIGGAATANSGTLRLGGATGSGAIAANTLAINAVDSITSQCGANSAWTHSGAMQLTAVATNALPTLALNSTKPVLQFINSTGGAAMKRWTVWVDGSGNLFTGTSDDAGVYIQNATQTTRTGANVTSHRFFINGSIQAAIDNTGFTVTGNLNPTGAVYAQLLSAAANPAVIASVTNSGVTSFSSSNLGGITMYDASQPVNARSCDLINYQGGVRFRLKNDIGGTVIEPLAFLGGYAGYTGIVSNSGNGTWTHISTNSTYPSPSFMISAPQDPMIRFGASGGTANRRNWYISGKNGNFLELGILNDNGATVTPAYHAFRGTDTVGGHNWFLGDNTITNPAMQLGVGGLTMNLAGIATADASAIIDLQSTTQGFLLPRMTSAQRNSIVSPADGLMVYDNITHDLYIYKAGAGGGWKVVTTTS